MTLTGSWLCLSMTLTGSWLTPLKSFLFGSAAVASFFSGATAHAGGLIEYWKIEQSSGLTLATSATGGHTATLHSPNFPNGFPQDATPAALGAGSTKSLYMESGVPNWIDPVAINLVTTSVSGEVSISMWISPDGAPSDSRILSQASGSASGKGATRISTGGSLDVWNGSGWAVIAPSAISAGSFATPVWQHLALVWDKNQVTAYVNGVNKGTATAEFDYGPTSGGLALYAPFALTSGAAFRGYVDDISIFNQALTSTQVASLAGGTSPLDVLSVPEPSSLVLLAVGLGLAFIRRGRSGVDHQ